MGKEKELKKRLKEINKLLKIVDPNKGCLAVDQRVKLEVEKKNILKKLGKWVRKFYLKKFILLCIDI